MSAQNEDGEWDFVTQQVLAGATDKRNKDASIIWNVFLEPRNRKWNLCTHNLWDKYIYKCGITEVIQIFPHWCEYNVSYFVWNEEQSTRNLRIQYYL